MTSNKDFGDGLFWGALIASAATQKHQPVKVQDVFQILFKMLLVVFLSFVILALGVLILII